MALKFLNKKGWHTGSLRNIENVWKAEQKHDAEQKKLEELRKQIQEERERNEFRLLQEKAGLVPAQERLDFLYDSGLSVGRSSSNEGFKALEAFPKSDGAAAATEAPSSSKQGANVPGALFEDKPQSANDAWRKLHSDPLLMIRQREQEALAKIKNNPVKMAMIKKSVEEKEHKAHGKKEKRKKHHSSKSKHKKHSDSEDDIAERRKGKDKKHSDSEDDIAERRGKDKKHFDSEDDIAERRKGKDKKHFDSEDDIAERRKRKDGDRDFDRKQPKSRADSEYDSSDEERKRRRNHYEDRKYRERSPSHHQRQRRDYNEDADDRNYKKSRSERYASERLSNVDVPRRDNGSLPEASSHRSSVTERESHHRRRNVAPKLSEEERAAKLRQMQLAAEVHEEQRWKRIKKAEETDAREATQNINSGGRNFLDAAQKSVYGAAEGGSASIAESVRRRTHYSQGRSGGEANAFRR